MFKIYADKRYKMTNFNFYFPLQSSDQHLPPYGKVLSPLSAEVTEGSGLSVSVAVQSVLICKERIFFDCCIITTTRLYPVIASLMSVPAILCRSIVCALQFDPQ